MGLSTLRVCVSQRDGDTPMTVEEFVTDRRHACDQNGPNFAPPKSS
jgi:hypothetical protein